MILMTWGSNMAEHNYKELSEIWFQKFDEFEREYIIDSDNFDVKYNQDSAILSSILFSLIYMRSHNVGFPTRFEESDNDSAAELEWNSYLDSLIKDFIYLIEHKYDLPCKDYLEIYESAFDRLKDILFDLWI